jgi:anti-anti-sigma factor
MALRLVLENPDKDTVLVRVRGVIDLATMPAWEDLIRRVIRRRTAAVIVEVSKVEHISARGLKMLLALAANQSVMKGCLIVVGAHSSMRNAARMVDLWDLASQATSVRAAVQKAEQWRADREVTRNVTKDVIRSSGRVAQQGGGQ